MVDNVMRKDDLDDSVLTLLCMDEHWSPIIAKQITDAFFPTRDYQRIAQFALAHIGKYKKPPGQHLRDYLGEELKRDGSFLSQIIKGMERLAPEIQGEFVQHHLDMFIVQRTMKMSLDGAYDAVNRYDMDGARLKLWEAINAAPAVLTTLFDPWADPVPPPFDIDILPREMRDIRAFVDDRNKMIGADKAGLFWSAMSCCSAAINGSVQLQMKEHDAYRVRPPLWLLMIGDPSSGRSPILKATWAPLRGLQTEANRRHAAAMARWQAMTKEEQREDQEPVPLEYMVDDITIEALQEIHADQDRGVAVLKDEVVGLVGSFSRYGGDRTAFERTYYLESHDGGPMPGVHRGRRGRGTGYRRPALNKLVTVCGGIQYNVLRKLDNLTDDGFLQRCNLILVPSMQIGSDEPSGAVAAYDTLIDYLAHAPGNRVLCLSQEALRIRERLERDLKEIEETTDINSPFRTHLGKLHGQWGRLTLVLSHIMEPGATVVTGAPAVLAEYLVKQQLIPHAARLYRWLGGGASDDDMTKQIAGYVLSHPAARLVVSDLTSNISALKGKGMRQVQDAVSPLESGGWLTPEQSRYQGRPHGWAINQQVFSQFAKRAELEKFKREQTRRLLQGGQTVVGGRAGAEMKMPDNPDCFGDDIHTRAVPRARAPNQDHQEREDSNNVPRARNQDCPASANKHSTGLDEDSAAQVLALDEEAVSDTAANSNSALADEVPNDALAERGIDRTAKINARLDGVPSEPPDWLIKMRQQFIRKTKETDAA